MEQQRETMISHNIPGRDLFELNGRDYLVTVDYYSNYFEVDRQIVQQARERGYAQAEKPLCKTWHSGPSSFR